MKVHELLWMLIAVVAAVCWNGCGGNTKPLTDGYIRGVYNVPPERREQFAAFVIDCSTAANPHSDEEGEDLVIQCEQTGRRILGNFVRQWCPSSPGSECFSCSGRNLHRGGCR